MEENNQLHKGNEMRQYSSIINKVLDGDRKGERTGTGAISTFNVNETFNLKNGFPIVTGKKTPFKLIAAELLWFLSGSTNNEDLRKINGNDKATIWEEWAGKEGALGPVYGSQWRDFGGSPVHNNSGMIGIAHKGVDQIQKVIDILRTDPNSRRMVVSAWNPVDLPDMALEPCHYAFEFYTREAPVTWRIDWARKRQMPVANEVMRQVESNAMAALDREGVPRLMVSCKVIQRSCDVFLGVPFNIASYALLTHLIAHCVGMIADDLHWSGGNTHIYMNHMEQIQEYQTRKKHTLPELIVSKDCPTDIDAITMEHFELKGYESGPHIAGDVAV